MMPQQGGKKSEEATSFAYKTTGIIGERKKGVRSSIPEMGSKRADLKIELRGKGWLYQRSRHSIHGADFTFGVGLDLYRLKKP